MASNNVEGLSREESRAMQEVLEDQIRLVQEWSPNSDFPPTEIVEHLTALRSQLATAVLESPDGPEVPEDVSRYRALLACEAALNGLETADRDVKDDFIHRQGIHFLQKDLWDRKLAHFARFRPGEENPVPLSRASIDFYINADEETEGTFLREVIAPNPFHPEIEYIFETLGKKYPDTRKLVDHLAEECMTSLLLTHLDRFLSEWMDEAWLKEVIEQLIPGLDSLEDFDISAIRRSIECFPDNPELQEYFVRLLLERCGDYDVIREYVDVSLKPYENS